MVPSFILKGSWDLVTRVIKKVVLITPIRVLITLLTKSPDPPSSGYMAVIWGSSGVGCWRVDGLVRRVWN